MREIQLVLCCFCVYSAVTLGIEGNASFAGVEAVLAVFWWYLLSRKVER